MSTVFTTMKNAWTWPSLLDRIILSRQQLYAIFKQAKWSYRDLLVDSTVDADYSVDHMLDGKTFNRAVRGVTLVYEAFYSLWFGAFFRWLNDQIEKLPENTLTLFPRLCYCFKQGKMPKPNLKVFFTLTEKFRIWSCGKSPTFMFWNMFLHPIAILLQDLQDVRSDREDNWILHLCSTAAMFPYMYVANRINCLRYIHVYLIDILVIPLDIEKAFQRVFNTSKAWKVQRSMERQGVFHYGFQMLWWNQRYNTSKTSPDDMVNYLTNACRLYVKNETQSGCINHKSVEHDEVKPTTLIQDEEQVQKVVDHDLHASKTYWSLWRRLLIIYWRGIFLRQGL